jgi:hypothetical protein
MRDDVYGGLGRPDYAWPIVKTGREGDGLTLESCRRGSQVRGEQRRGEVRRAGARPGEALHAGK